MSAADVLTDFLGPVDAAHLAECIATNRSIIGALDEGARTALAAAARPHRLTLLMATPGLAARALVTARSDYAGVLDTPGGRNWLRGELRAFRALL